MWRNLLLTFIILVLCAFIMYVTIFQLDPMGPQRNIAFLAFGASMLFGVWSFMTLLFFFGAELLSGHKLGQQSFLIAIRRGFLVSGFTVSLTSLQFLNLLTWTEALLIGIFFALLEWIFLTGKYY